MRRLLLILLLISFRSLGQTLESDRLALVAMYNGFSGAAYPELANWVVPGGIGDSPCGWYGVTCEGNRVTKLDLKYLGIQGSLAPEVGNLTALTTLDLSGLGGELGAWTGELPATVGNLTNLEYLHLSENRFGIANMGVIGNLTKLKSLALTPMGPIPSQFANLVNLERLYLGADEAMGIGDESPFPLFLTTLPKLKELYLIQQVEGALPPEIGNLSNLEVLVLDRNFSMDPQLPAQIGSLSKLRRLRIAQHDTFSDLGPIPFDLRNFPDLEELEIQGFRFSGTIPADFWNLTKLQKLTIGGTKFSGPIPATISSFPDLTELRLVDNAFSGPLPNLLNIPVLGIVDLRFNAFTFAGMESNISRLDLYSPQALIDAYLEGPLCVGCIASHMRVTTAGGTVANNTYKLFKNNVLLSTQVGNDLIPLDGEGIYRAEVTNSIATGLTLVTKTFTSIKLPVILVSFEGKSENNQTKLTWKTAEETNNKGFEIERSADARTFEKIGFVDGSGDTKENQSYHFTDLSPLAISYYRLKQLDYDGKFEYSKIIRVKGDQVVFKIYPNPAQDNLMVSGIDGEQDLHFLNSAGRVVMATKVTTGKPVSIRSLKPGLYTIKVGSEGGKVLINR